MKKILRLNEAEGNLELLRFGEGLIVVNKTQNENFDNGDAIYYELTKTIFTKTSTNIENWIKEYCFKVIFATSNLDLKVPQLLYKRNDVLLAIKTITTWDSFKDHPIGQSGKIIENWYESKNDLFTENDLKDYFELRLRFWQNAVKDVCINSNRSHEAIGIDIKNASEISHNLSVQYLKAPKVEIYFDENFKPIKCVEL